MGIDFKTIKNKPKQKCKGLYWRARASSHFDHTTGNMVVTKRLKLLKRKSCKGCESCNWFFEFMHEEVLNGEHDYSEKYLDDIEHGAVYTYKLETSTDFESGISEIDEVKFVKVIDVDNPYQK